MGESPSTATLMFIAHRAAESRVHQTLRDNGFADLTPAQARIAQRMKHAGIRVTELAEQARVTKQTAGALVDDLERHGYVTRAPDPSDARARLVVLTAKGLRLCAAATAEVATIERRWREHLGERAYDQMHRSLERLREITDPFS